VGAKVNLERAAGLITPVTRRPAFFCGARAAGIDQGRADGRSCRKSPQVDPEGTSQAAGRGAGSCRVAKTSALRARPAPRHPEEWPSDASQMTSDIERAIFPSSSECGHYNGDVAKDQHKKGLTNSGVRALYPTSSGIRHLPTLAKKQAAMYLYSPALRATVRSRSRNATSIRRPRLSIACFRRWARN
jgi:hypothetical protein